MTRKIFLRWLCVLAWMIVIFLLSHEPAVDSSLRSDSIVLILKNLGFAESADVLSTIIRKTAHVTMFFVLSLLILRAVWQYKISLRNKAIITIVSATFFAITDEVHQMFIPGRSGELKDVAIDFLGIIFAVGCVLAVIYFRREAYKIIK